MKITLRVARHNSPSEERGTGDEEGEDPHAEADVEGEALGAPPPRVADRPRDGQVTVDRDGAQAACDDDGGDRCHCQVRLYTYVHVFHEIKSTLFWYGPKRLE